MMARSIASRLERAARTTRLRQSHCPACKGQRVVTAFDDGDGVPDPDPCERCGRMPLQIVFGWSDDDGGHDGA